MGKHGGKILQYCRDNNIAMKALAERTGVSLQELKAINRDPRLNLTVAIIEKLYNNTQEGFTKPLSFDMYSDYKIY